MIRKITAVAVFIIIMFTLTACSDKTDEAFMLDDVSISSGVYAYYLDKVKSEPKAYGADAEDEESIKAAAKKCCISYGGAIRLLQKKGIILANEFKRQAAENTENIWSLFSQHYENIGVTKQDITKIQTHECRKLQLLNYYFGADGIAPVSDMDLKEEFVDIYVGFKVIVGSLTKENDKGETIELTDSEKAEIEKKFTNMASQINSGTATIDELNVQYNDSLDIIVTGNLTTELMKQGDPMYDDDFFSQVMSLTHGKAKMIKSGSSIYVVERQTIATTDEDAFAVYRSEVLESVKMPSIIEKIENNGAKMTVTENEKVTEKVEKLILG